jgi:hypothetical protein
MAIYSLTLTTTSIVLYLCPCVFVYFHLMIVFSFFNTIQISRIKCYISIRLKVPTVTSYNFAAFMHIVYIELVVNKRFDLI